MPNDWDDHLDGFHDVDAYLADLDEQEAAAARAEELSLYRSPKYTYSRGAYTVERDR